MRAPASAAPVFGSWRASTTAKQAAAILGHDDFDRVELYSRERTRELCGGGDVAAVERSVEDSVSNPNVQL